MDAGQEEAENKQVAKNTKNSYQILTRILIHLGAESEEDPSYVYN